jgi:hypothetical protein
MKKPGNHLPPPDELLFTPKRQKPAPFAFVLAALAALDP